MIASQRETAGASAAGTKWKSYIFRQLVPHLSGGEEWDRLFELLEKKSFLAEQADYFSGFEASSRLFPTCSPLESLRRRWTSSGRRYGWMPDQEAGLLLNDITGLVVRKEAFLWFSLRSSGSDWLEALATLISESTVDPSTPAYSPLLDRLWQCDPDTSRKTLASSLINALKGGGRERGETVLRFWLHTHLAPVLGTEQPEAEDRHKDAGAALESSLVLSP